MGLRMRRSIGLGGGVRLNLGLRGVGVSGGVRGLRYSVHSSGRQTAIIGLPGTGLSYVTTLNAGGRRRSTARSSAKVTPAIEPVAPRRAGLFSPGYEKEYAKGVEAYRAGDTVRALVRLRSASSKDTSDHAISDDLLLGVLELMSGNASAAIPALEKVVASKHALPDQLLLRYLPGATVELQITPLVRVVMGWSSLLGALALAEAYQVERRLDEAIGLLQKIHFLAADPALTLSLCELLSQNGAWADVVALSAGVANDDDLSLQVRLFQAAALERLGLRDAAVDAYRDCLRSKKRTADLLIAARYARGRLLLDLGKRSPALRDLGTVYAYDPHYLDVADLLASAKPVSLTAGAPR